ncbi:MAG: hypothetical protein HY318_18010, partial [Armatimonadetes bacterium]|nr:hypothetical protein [Armatimonadota bacterium]
MENTRTKIREVIDQHEIPGGVGTAATEAFISGEYEKASSLLTAFTGEFTEDMQDTLVWSYVMQGNALSDQAETKQGAEADRLFVEACQMYAAAVKIKPDYHDAVNNWGFALSSQAETKEGAEADRLFGEAYQKYGKALEIKPDNHKALYNWGTALSDQAKT